MAGEIYDIEDYKHQLIICGDKHVHVYSLDQVRRWAAGQVKASEVEDLDDFFPQIIKEWLHERGC